jgi:TRAP-type C4-dicarboxylate transport system permease small subunit
MRILFWFGVLLITQAVAYVPICAAFPATWLYWSLGVGVLGFILLIVLREIERYRYGESGPNWRGFSDATDKGGDLDD